MRIKYSCYSKEKKKRERKREKEKERKKKRENYFAKVSLRIIIIKRTSIDKIIIKIKNTNAKIA